MLSNKLGPPGGRMREVVLQMHVTLDGFADSKEGFVPINDRQYWRDLDKILQKTGAGKADALLLGKGTYTQFASFWPHAAHSDSTPKDLRASAKFLDDIPKFVFSKSLPRVEWRNSTLLRGDLRKEIARLKRQRGGNLLVLGGVAFPRALIEGDLIDEYLLSVVPILCGAGRDRLFGPLIRQRTLELRNSWTFKNGVVLHHYRRARKPWSVSVPEV